MTNRSRANIPSQDRKLLWGKAGNRCAICRKFLVNSEDGDERGVIVGIEAHIVGHSKSGPRGNESLPKEQRHLYENMILLCVEHARTIDERTDIYSAGKLREIKKKHEMLMKGVDPSLTRPHPRLRLIQPVGYTGGSNGHFQTLKLKNFDEDPALDLRCWMEGFGFHAVLADQSAGSFIDGKSEKEYKFQLDGLEIGNRNIQLLYFYANYRNLDGEKIQYKSSLTQKDVSSKAFKILDLGLHHSYGKLITEAEVDNMSPLEPTGDYMSTLFEVGNNHFKISVSNTVLALWQMNDQWIKHCLLHLGKSNVKIMASLGIFQDKKYTSYNLPPECQSGFEGFEKTLELIEAGEL